MKTYYIEINSVIRFEWETVWNLLSLTSFCISHRAERKVNCNIVYGKYEYLLTCGFPWTLEISQALLWYNFYCANNFPIEYVDTFMICKYTLYMFIVWLHKVVNLLATDFFFKF
jgi:hypothetical protein